MSSGEVIDATSRWRNVSSDDALVRLDGFQIDRVVGRVALVDLAEGTLLTTSVIADAATVQDGDGVVGLLRSILAYLARGLARVIAGQRRSLADVADLGADPAVIARDATVFAVDDHLASDRLLVWCRNRG